MFLEVDQNPQLFFLAFSLNLLHLSMSSLLRYLCDSFDSSAYPSAMVIYRMLALSLKRVIVPKRFVSSL